MKALSVLLGLVVALVLTGCGEAERPDPIERGKACFDAGGSWTWDNWTGYHCEFEAVSHE